MRTTRKLVLAASLISLLICLAVFVPAAAAQTPDHETMERASRLMGFDLSKVNHHFVLLTNGGAIEITAKDPKDKQTVDAIQKHLMSQAKLWERGNFDLNTQIHGKVPDGVPTIKKLRNEITFDVRPLDDGGLMRILTVNQQAKQSVYEFMRFQINEHHTGDSLQVE